MICVVQSSKWELNQHISWHSRQFRKLVLKNNIKHHTFYNSSLLPANLEDGNTLSSPWASSLLHRLPWYMGSSNVSPLWALKATSQETLSALGHSALASKATPHFLFLVSDALFIVICLSSISHGDFQLPVLTTLYTVLPLMPTWNGNTYFFC